MPGASGRLEGRNGIIWRDFCAGATQEALAEEHGISQSRISQIITEVRASLPAADVDAARAEHVEFLNRMRRQAAEIAAKDPAPAYSNGRPILDEDGRQVLDYGGQLKAMETAIRIGERASKLLGLDAPAKIEHGLSEQASQAAATAAADALSRLHGGAE
jgi:hypothetical protein